MNGDEIEIYEDAKGEFRWRRQAANGEIISDGAEGYTRYADAKRAAERANPDLEVPDRA